SDYQKANDELRTFAVRHNVTIPPVASKEYVDKQQQLREKEGVDFDEDYIDLIVNDHNRVVSLFEDAANEIQNTGLQAFALKSLPTLKNNLEEAKAIQDSINPMDTTTIQRVLP